MRTYSAIATNEQARFLNQAWDSFINSFIESSFPVSGWIGTGAIACSSCDCLQRPAGTGFIQVTTLQLREAGISGAENVVPVVDTLEILQPLSCLIAVQATSISLPIRRPANVGSWQ